MSRRWWSEILRPRFFTPKGFRILAGAFAVVFLACHVVGLRSYTCVLCGQSPTGDSADVLAFGLGALYLMLYAAFVVATPILALASLVFGGIEAIARRRPPATG